MLRAFSNRNYRLWALADLVSVTGTWMQVLGLNWVVMERTGSATSVGLSVAFSTIPAMVCGPWAGALADRVSPRRIIVIGESLHLVIALLLAVTVWHGLPLPVLFALTTIAGLVGTFEGPALGRFASQVVPRSDLGNALAWNSVTNAVGRVLGMSLAGVLAAVIGEPALFCLNAASFGAVIATVLVMRSAQFHPLARSTREYAGVMAGLRYLRTQHVLLVLFALGFVLSSLGRNYQVTMAAMAEGPLNAGSAGYGTLSSVFAVGTVLGGLAAARERLHPAVVAGGGGGDECAAGGQRIRSGTDGIRSDAPAHRGGRGGDRHHQEHPTAVGRRRQHAGPCVGGAGDSGRGRRRARGARPRLAVRTTRAPGSPTRRRGGDARGHLRGGGCAAVVGAASVLLDRLGRTRGDVPNLRGGETGRFVDSGVR